MSVVPAAASAPLINAPLVSILVPTYNRAGYLRGALHSALAQTYAPLEVIVLDDASSDPTPDVAAEFAADPRVRCVRHAANGGIAENWRAGIEAARGTFFCLLHDDDTFEPGFVEALIAPLRNDPDLIVCFCDHFVMDAAGRRSGEATEAARRRFKRDALAPGRVADFARAALVNASVPVGAALFRRARVGPDFIAAEARGAIDMWLLYQCIKTGGGAFYVDQKLMNYRSHAGGMSAGAAPLYMNEGHLFRLRHLIADPDLGALRPDLRHLLVSALTSQALRLLEHGRRGEARTICREALRQRRFSGRLVAACVLAWSGGAAAHAATLTRSAQRLRRRLARKTPA